MALGSTESLVKMITRNIPGVKGGRCVRLTTSPSSRPECHEIWEPKPPGTLWVCNGSPLPFTHLPNDVNQCTYGNGMVCAVGQYQHVINVLIDKMVGFFGIRTSQRGDNNQNLH
jgi:hypothetical protein